MENNKRADKMWESENINTLSSKAAEDNKKDHQVGKHKNSKEPISWKDADKEEQTLNNCRDKDPKFKETFFKMG